LKTASVLLMLGILLSPCADAAPKEKKPLKDVAIPALTDETQRISYSGGVHIAWWMPPEFWEATLARDSNVTDAEREGVMEILRKHSMLAVVQGEVGTQGDISFYSREAITKGLKIELSDTRTWTELAPVKKVPDDLARMLDVFGPMLSAAIGSMGENLNFFVLEDQKKGKRLISPYEPGALRISLKNDKGEEVEPFLIELPLDSLYVPRLCPNGKPAHISWVVCPWDGSKLPQ